jgi:trimethylamine--corrinoid protein Co-methyltransferase
MWQMHSDADLQRIDAAAIHLLEKSGCRIDHAGLLTKLEAAGCRIDWPASRAFMPEALVRRVVEAVSPHSGPEVEMPHGWQPPRRVRLDGSFPHLLDWPSGLRRLATREDVIAIGKMGHVLPEIDVIGRALTCSEIDPRIEPLWAVLTLAQITDKPLGPGEIFFPAYIAPLVRMGELLSGKPGDTALLAECDFFIAPLVLEHAQAECFLEKRRFGMRNVPGSMPISGISSPVTLAGTVAICVAELLAGWVLGYVIDPTLPVSGIVASGSLDMRTTTPLFGSPEALLQDMTTLQVCRRLYGIPIWAATTYVDCKHPGLDAVWQKMYPLVAAPFGAGLNVGGDGLLSAGQDYSPVQHLLELEIMQSLDRFWAGFEVNPESLALDLIEQVIASGSTNFLDNDHTLAHYKSEQWYPRWFERTAWQGLPHEAESEAAMLARIDAYWKAAVARYQPPDLDAAKLKELRLIYDHFTQLCGFNQPF